MHLVVFEYRDISISSEWECMYISIHIWMCTYIDAHGYIHISFELIHLPTYVYIYVYTDIDIATCLWIYVIFIYMWVCIYAGCLWGLIYGGFSYLEHILTGVQMVYGIIMLKYSKITVYHSCASGTFFGVQHGDSWFILVLFSHVHNHFSCLLWQISEPLRFVNPEMNPLCTILFIYIYIEELDKNDLTATSWKITLRVRNYPNMAFP